MFIHPREGEVHTGGRAGTRGGGTGPCALRGGEGKGGERRGGERRGGEGRGGEGEGRVVFKDMKTIAYTYFCGLCECLQHCK